MSKEESYKRLTLIWSIQDELEHADYRGIGLTHDEVKELLELINEGLLGKVEGTPEKKTTT